MTDESGQFFRAQRFSFTPWQAQRSIGEIEQGDQLEAIPWYNR